MDYGPYSSYKGRSSSASSFYVSFLQATNGGQINRPSYSGTEENDGNDLGKRESGSGLFDINFLAHTVLDFVFSTDDCSASMFIKVSWPCCTKKKKEEKKKKKKKKKRERDIERKGEEEEEKKKGGGGGGNRHT